jgi:hypothetical protein
LSDGTNFLVKAFGVSHVIGVDLCDISQSGDCYKWMERASEAVNRRRFAQGEQGYYALWPLAAKQGDKLCLLLGGQTLFCLRPNGDSYLFVGEFYVHGIMYGEALDMSERGHMTLTVFMIR